VQQIARLLDHLLGCSKQSQRHVETKRLSRLEIDPGLEFRRRLDRQLSRLFTAQYAIHVSCGLADISVKSGPYEIGPPASTKTSAVKIVGTLLITADAITVTRPANALTPQARWRD
jgi:hypothetical protein